MYTVFWFNKQNEFENLKTIQMLSKTLVSKNGREIDREKQRKTRHTGMLNKIIVSTEQDGG
jgi:hypothetical protein